MNAEAARRAIAGLGRGRVLVAGDLMLDRYWSGPVPRISPEAPVVVVSVQSDETRVGGAGNVATNVAALGTHVTVLGLVGDDEPGRQLQRLLEGAGVNPTLVRQRGLRTTEKLRVMSRHQQLMRLDFEDPATDQGAELLCATYQSLLAACDVVVLSDYAKGALSRASVMIEQARRAGRPVLVDPKGLDFAKYRGATLITPNLAEFRAIVGEADGDAAIEAKARRLAVDLEFGAVLVTRGERGMSLVPPHGPAVHLPAEAREVFDVTGAGDTVVATIAAGFAAGSDLIDAVSLANVAAGIVVTKLGTASVSRAELQTLLQRPDADLRRGVVDEPTLLGAVLESRRRGERIVMTNGCFDVLHPGHVSYLAQARALGDRLIVAVNDDASVRALKGAGRPIHGLGTRQAMLAALASVDWTVAFAESTPERLIAAVRPDVLVKGGDYRAEEIAGGDFVRAAGGEVRVLPFVDGHSSTATINRIRAVTQ